MTTAEAPSTVRSNVPARIDRLPWSRFHWLVVFALGVAWILDGLEVQMAASIAPVLQDEQTLGLSTSNVTWTVSIYLLGEVVGALWFGRLSDRLGRRRLFLITLGVYLVANGLTGFSWDLWSFLVLRFIAGMGIGGEYAAINSAIDELIPARYRGRVDIAINGTYWAGAAIGAAAQLILLDPDILPKDLGWRICLFVGPVIGIAIWRLRKHVPESPRWLLTHGRADEAERVIEDIERGLPDQALEELSAEHEVEVRPTESVSYRQIAKVMLRDYPRRSVLGFTLMVTQSFLYNAIFFTYSLVLAHFYNVPDERIPLYFFPFAVGNLLGPLLLGRLFDTWGRRPMIAGTYIVSAVILAISGYLFYQGVLTATTQTILWCVVFFLASAGASSAYLTVSEIFPLELRAQAIALFFAIAQLCGGVVAPKVFGWLIGEGTDRFPLFLGYVGGGAVMLIGGVVAAWLGVNAERRSLEHVAQPLSMINVGRPAEAASGRR
jgi:MFS family permease